MNPITVSALGTHIVFLFENDEVLRDVWVTGEVSNWKRAGSGHVYFSMKDSGASINAVMWRTSVAAQSWLPQAGDQIIAHGYVGVYPERGVYQLYVNQIRPAGRGELYAQYEALKARLQEEGLFDTERKRRTPSHPAQDWYRHKPGCGGITRYPARAGSALAHRRRCAFCDVGAGQ